LKNSKTSWALSCLITIGVALNAMAEDEPNVPTMQPHSAGSGIVPKPAASRPAPGRPRGVPPALPPHADGTASLQSVSPGADHTTAGPSAGGAGEPNFVAEDKWGMAGYNNNEPVYTILVTSHDSRIIRCTADLKGTYIENGEREPVTDRQTITVFPNSEVQVGNWAGMDQQAGATFAVKCRPI
jgi:hypothetical protein